MKLSKILPYALAVILLCVTVAVTSNTAETESTEETKIMSVSSNITDEEMRAVWVSYMDLDMQSTDKTYNTFKKKFKKIADTSKDKGFNTLILQVRPFSDALYDSAYFPFSHILTGTQGKDPGYDPLKYMCSYSHKIGLAIHAWINPYRVKTESSPKKLADNNPYKNNNSLGVTVGKAVYYNPALNSVRMLIEKGIKEIVKNYDIDGIQFDDYFYPTQSKSFDKEQYAEYVKNTGAGNAISLKKWRTANVNILISEVYNLIHTTKKDVVFGISPQGNISNDYNMCADVKSWCRKEGYIDYICPQLYYSMKNPALSYPDALKEWLKLEYSDTVTLYIGIAGYKTGTDSDDGTWNDSSTILKREVKLLRKKGIKGFMFYSYQNLVSKKAEKEVSNLIMILN